MDGFECCFFYCLRTICIDINLGHFSPFLCRRAFVVWTHLLRTWYMLITCPDSLTHSGVFSQGANKQNVFGNSLEVVYAHAHTHAHTPHFRLFYLKYDIQKIPYVHNTITNAFYLNNLRTRYIFEKKKKSCFYVSIIQWMITQIADYCWCVRLD